MYKYTVTLSPDAVRSDPGVEGIDVSDTEWRLDVDRYRDFLAESTGIAPADGLSASDCYRIGNRLQALVEEHKCHDEWDPALVEDYSDVDSLDEFLWVARFFRACHDCHDAGELCFASHEPEESSVASRESC